MFGPEPEESDSEDDPLDEEFVGTDDLGYGWGPLVHCPRAGVDWTSLGTWTDGWVGKGYDERNRNFLPSCFEDVASFSE